MPAETAAAVVERIAARARAARADDEATYWAFVRAAAAPDGRPDPDAIVDFLAATGRDGEQFQADVERIAARYEAVAAFATVPALDAERAKLQAEIDAAEAAYRRAGDAWNEAITRHRPTILHLEARIETITRHHLELARTCPDQALVAACEAVGRRVVELQSRWEGLNRVRQGIAYAVETDEAKDPRTHPAAAANAETARRRLADVEAELERVAAALFAARREAAALEARRLLP